MDSCREKLEKIVSEFNKERSALLPALRAIQDEYGFVPEESITALADLLGVSRAEIYSLVSFYSLLSFRHRGKFVVRVCNSLTCHIKGSKDLQEAIEKFLGIKPGQTTEDGLFSLEYVSCLGLCDKAPAFMINEREYGNVKPKEAIEILNKIKEEN